jgi:hypothetical protein
MLLGNKADAETRQVDTAEVEALCARAGLEFREVSAKTGYGVRAAFSESARITLKKTGSSVLEAQGS